MDFMTSKHSYVICWMRWSCKHHCAFSIPPCKDLMFTKNRCNPLQGFSLITVCFYQLVTFGLRFFKLWFQYSGTMAAAVTTTNIKTVFSGGFCRLIHLFFTFYESLSGAFQTLMGANGAVFQIAYHYLW